MRHRLFLVLLMFLLLLVSSCSEKGDVADRIRIYDSNVLTIPETTYWKDGKPVEKLEGEDLRSIIIKYDPGKVKSNNPGFEFTQVAIYTFDENGEDELPMATVPATGDIALGDFADSIKEGISLEFVASPVASDVDYVFRKGMHADYVTEHGLGRSTELIRFFGNDEVSVSFPRDESIGVRIIPEEGWRVSGYYINDDYFPVRQVNTGTYLKGSVGLIGVDNDWSASFSIKPDPGVDAYRIAYDIRQLKYFQLSNECSCKVEVFRDDRFRDRIPFDSDGKGGIFISGEDPIYLYVEAMRKNGDAMPVLSSMEPVRIRDISPVNASGGRYYEIAFPEDEVFSTSIVLNIGNSVETGKGDGKYVLMK